MQFEQEDKHSSRTPSNIWHGLHESLEAECGNYYYDVVDSLVTFLYFWGTDGILLTLSWVLSILKYIYMAKTLIIYCKNFI